LAAALQLALRGVRPCVQCCHLLLLLLLLLRSGQQSCWIS
jgi:hypothetical protein